MKPIYLTITFILFVLLIFPLVSTFLIKNISNDLQPSLEGTQGIYKNISAAQHFTSKLDNLEGLGMSIKNPYFRNKSSIDFKVFSEYGILLRTINLNGINIKDGDFIRINFPLILNSKDKKYYFEVIASDTESANALEIFITSQSRSWVGGLDINGKKTEYNFSFITYHHITNPLTIYFEVVSNLLKRLFTDLPFGIFYSCLLFVLSVYMIFLKKMNQD